MTQPLSDLTIAIGRSLLGLYFLIPGFMKFAAIDMHLGLMQHHGVPMALPLLIIAGIANITGGLLLLSNRFVRATSLGFVVYILLVNLLLHDFWSLDGLEARHEMQNFIKNLGIVAGALVLAGASPARPLNLTGLWRSDRTYLT